MPLVIAFFRGINVGGKGKLPMKELISLLEDLGGKNVKTYIQSGNAVFESKDKIPAKLAKKITGAINEQFDFEPKVVMLTHSELEQAIAKNPFPKAVENHKSLHLGFMDAAPTKPDLAKLTALKLKNEEFKIIGRVFYLLAPDGVGNSKLAAGAEKAIGVPITMRNWRTVCAVRDLADE